ncbi:hypothetical protein TeGR_g13348, partial [Tetraparma gracilis]
LVEELLKCDDQFHVFWSHDENMVTQFDMFVNRTWARLPGTVREPVSYFEKVDENSNKWGKAEGVVDASAPDVLAWLWYLCTHERNLDHERNNGNLLRMELDVPGTRSKFMMTSMKMPGAISNRVFANWWTWAKEKNGDLVAAFTPHEDYGPGAEKQIVDAALEAMKSSVVGKLRGFYRIKTLAPNVCRVTLVAKGSLGGSFTKQAMAWAVKSSLGMVKTLQDKYMRNGAKVDAEMRGAFPAPPPRRSLTSEQDALVARCLSLEKGAEASSTSNNSSSKRLLAVVGNSAAAQAWAVKGSWVELKSTSPFVSLSMAYGNESSIALGKAKATLDCRAREAFTYQSAVCGREDMRISREGGDRARFIFKEHTKHDFEWASVKKMPFPLTDREFLCRYLSFKEPAGDLVVVFEALPDSTKVDYGANLKVVRGKSMGVVRFRPINDDTQCEVTLIQHGDAGGYVPERVVVAKIPQALSGVAEMRELFQRDDAVDGAERSELADIINTSEQPYLPDEDSLIDEVRTKFASLPAFEKLDSPDHFVHMSSAFKEGSSNAIGMATTIVDAPIAEVAAWAGAEMSRENRKEHVAFGGLDRNLKKINDHQNIFHVVYDFSIPTFLPRQFVVRIVWKWDEDKQELTVVADSVEHTDFLERKEYLRASCTGICTYKQEAEVGKIPQTKVTWTQQLDLGGRIPKWAQNRQGVGTLMYLSKMRERFDQSLELEGKKRGELVKMIRRHGRDGVEYSEEEEKIMAEGKTWFKAFDGLKSKDVAMRSPQSKGKVAYEKGDSRVWGWSTATLRASPEELLAYVWDTKSRQQMSSDDLEREIDEKPNAHNQLVFIKKQMPAVISNRDFLGRAVWKKAEDGGFVVVTAPEESLKRPANKRRGSRKKSSMKGDFAIRGTYKCATRIEKVDNEWTRIVQVIQPDVGGSIPSSIANSWIASRLAGVTTIQEYFQERRGMDDYEKADGRALGYRLTYPDEKNKTTPSEAVARVVKLHKGLSELSQEYPWIVAFLEEAVKGSLSMAGTVSTKLDCVSEAEARRMGKSLSKALRARKTADSGVLQWKNQNPSMVELFEKYPWVEEMVETMGEENAAWGLWFRVITGSGLSIMDLATDINMILVYFGEEGQEGYGWMMLGMVLASMGLQLLVVVGQNGKMGWGKLLREVLITVSGLKPGVDAMRVVSNAEMEEYQLIDAKSELVFTKVCEMFCESIPGCILQVYALIQGGSGGQMGTKVFSIVVSAITTGMGSAAISYDFDSDPENRRKLPDFYGYLPDEGNARTIMYVCMVVNSALLLLLRSIGAALLMIADPKIFIAYMAGDHLLYLLHKLMRGDFLHWMPVEGFVGVLFAILMRVIVKTLTDFTGVIQFRGAGELGGVMWLWTMVLALVAPWVAVPVYFGSPARDSTDAMDDEEGGETSVDFDQYHAWRLLGGLTAGWVIAFAVFLSLMKTQFRSTFWSIETGNEWIQSYFLHGGSDSIKMHVLTKNKAKWKAIEPQVKEWVGEGWMGWERDKPDWFTDNWKSRVPADWVPNEGKAEHRKARERSVAERGRKGGVLRASAKKLVNVMGGDGGDERPERRVWEGRRDAEEEKGSAEAVRGGSRVQPVTR